VHFVHVQHQLLLNIRSFGADSLFARIMHELVLQFAVSAGAGHRSRIRILRIFSFLKFNEFYDFFSVEKNS